MPTKTIPCAEKITDLGLDQGKDLLTEWVQTATPQAKDTTLPLYDIALQFPEGPVQNAMKTNREDVHRNNGMDYVA